MTSSSSLSILRILSYVVLMCLLPSGNISLSIDYFSLKCSFECLVIFVCLLKLWTKLHWDNS